MDFHICYAPLLLVYIWHKSNMNHNPYTEFFDLYALHFFYIQYLSSKNLVISPRKDKESYYTPYRKYYVHVNGIVGEYHHNEFQVFPIYG